MSFFCQPPTQPSNKDEPVPRQISLRMFWNAIQNKNGMRLSENQFVLKTQLLEDKVLNSLTYWNCSHQLSQLTIMIFFQLINTKKQLEKRLAQHLNREFRAFKLIYLKPKMTLSFKIILPDMTNLALIFQRQIERIVSYLTQLVERIRQIERQHQKLLPFQDLYNMRQCFQFNRSSRNKCSKISLKGKRCKNVTQVLRLLGDSSTTLNKLQTIYVQVPAKKYEQARKKVIQGLEQDAKNAKKLVQQSILTSIQILSVDDEYVIEFGDEESEQASSMISKAVYTYKKQTTIHEGLQLNGISLQVHKQVLVRKQKTQRDDNQFQNQVKFLLYIKNNIHPHIANYFCRLEEWPFKSQAIYIQHYQSSMYGISHKLSSQKKLRIVHQITKVLNFLNYRKICHRDLKQDNIMIDKEVNVRIIDWGSVCSMYSKQNQSNALKVKDQRLFSTKGYFQRFYEDVYPEQFGKKYLKQQIQKGQFFDIYSFGFIVQKAFGLLNSDMSQWIDLELQYLSGKCRQKNPADRLTAIQLQIYVTLLRKKIKKFNIQGLSSPFSSNA